MSVSMIRCPACGASLEAPGPGALALCETCGTHLFEPLALDGNAGAEAHRADLERERLAEVEALAEALRSAGERALERATQSAHLLALLVALVALAASVATGALLDYLGAGVAVGLSLALLSYRLAHAWRRRVRGERAIVAYRARMAALQRERAALRQREEGVAERTTEP